MLFWKSAFAFFAITVASICLLFVHAQEAQATASFENTFIATAPTSTVGTIRHVRVDPSNGKVYVLGSSTARLGAFSADGTTFDSINYDTTQLASAGSDFAVSQGRLFIVTYFGSSNNTLYRFDVSDGIANLIAYSSLATGAAAITFDHESQTVYTTKSTTARTYSADLSTASATSTLTYTPARLAYGGGSLFYLSTTGRFIRSLLGDSDTTIATGGPTSASVKGLVASNDGSALYYASNSSFSKLSVAGGNVLWTTPLSNLAGIDVSTSTGRITVINSSGAVSTYLPITAISSATASASGTSALLEWSNGTIDGDLAGVTIRRSTSSYPTNAADGVLVTSTAMGTSFTDTDLSTGTYYYSFFNQTSDGYFSAAATSSVTIDPPPDAPLLSAEGSGSTISLSWTVPADTASFVLRRSLVSFPTNRTEGTAVTTTVSSITGLNETGMPDGTYYYSLFAVDAGEHSSLAGTASVTIDTTAPSTPVVSASVSGTSISLHWDVPLTTASFLLRRDTASFPMTVSQGTAVTSTFLTSLTQSGLSDGTYYYSLFAGDDYGNYSSPGTVSATIDTTGPSAPTSLSAAVNNNTISLSWSNPPDADFASVVIRRSTTTFPLSITDGTAVTTTTLTNYADASLADGAYYYSLFAIDARENVSLQTTVQATVNTYVAPAAPRASGGGAIGGGGSIISPSIFHVTQLSFPAPTVEAPRITVPVSGSYPISGTALAVPPLTTDRGSSPTFKRTLRQGMSGADVKALQVFLNSNGFPITKTGAGSPGKETMFFGPATAKAVTKFQERHADTILQPYGLKNGTGIVGLNMRELLNSR
jgi:hypothetical protein